MRSSTFRLAWRNLGRNRRRTLISGASLAIGTALCVATFGLTDGLNADMLRSLTRLDLGHVQIHDARFAKERKLRRTVARHAAVVAATAKVDGVVAAAPRVYAHALFTHGEKSAGVELIGVDPDAEPRVTDLHREKIAGAYLDRAPVPWPWGSDLTPAERERDDALTKAAEAAVLDELDALTSLGGEAKANANASVAGSPAAADVAQVTRRLAEKLSPAPQRAPRIFIGRSLARLLGVGVGERVFALSQTVDGNAAEVHLEVAGIYRTHTETYDRGRAYLHLGDLQRLVRLRDQAHEIAVVVEDAHDAPAIAAAITAAVTRSDVVVRDWATIRPAFKAMLGLNDASTTFMVVIIFVVAAIGVVNTMLMAVFERTRELGMLKAIGMPAGRIVRLIVAEAFLLALASSFVGTAIGLGLDAYMIIVGLDLGAITDGIALSGVGLRPVLRGAITVGGVLTPTAILSVLCVVAALYPAVRAARMPAAAGMRDL